MKNFYNLPAILILSAVACTLPAGTRAATITVTNTSDSGAGSLRAALGSAANGDTIYFSLPLPASITLSNGELFVTNNLTILGPGPANLALSGNTSNRVFNIATNSQVTLAGLTIRDGRAGAGAGGGGIFNSGTLGLSNCLVAFNAAGDGVGGPSSGGDGGGLLNLGEVTAVACTFQSNRGGTGGPGLPLDPFTKTATPGGSGGKGGGIFNGGSLTLNSCTFYDNHAGTGGRGGGTSVGGSAASGGPGGNGGGIFSAGALACVACTFSGNQSGDGGSGGLAISVFSGGYGGPGGFGGFGGGIYNAGPADSATARNSIVALNAVGSAGLGGFGISASGPPGFPGSLPDLSGPFISQGRNLVGVINGSTGITNALNGNIAGTTDNPVHPRLGAFQDNGGPTWTMSLLTGSPAIDAGDDTLTGNDQRGFPRLSGTHVDIGACEGVAQLFSRGEALLVGDGWNNSIAAIEVRSGVTVGTFVQPAAGVNYKIAGPRGLLCVSNNLLVVNQNVDTPYNGEILAFDLNTGVLISKRVPSSNPNAPYAPRGMILGPNGTLYVADVGGFDGVHPGRIARYNSQGQFLGNVNTSGLGIPFYPMGLVTGPDGLLYVSGVGDLSQGSVNGYVFRFQFNSGTQNYSYLSTIVSSTAANYYAPRLHAPEGIVFGPDGNFYVTSFYASYNNNQGGSVVDLDAILVFNKNGQRIGSPISLYSTNDTRVFAQSLLFGPRGDLFVPITSGAQVRRYTASSSFQQFTVLPVSAATPREPWYLTFRGTHPSTLAYEPPKLTGLLSGDSFDVSWPATFTGWQLQVQTNTLATGLSSNWVNVAASTSTNRLSIIRDPANCVVYRLAAP